MTAQEVLVGKILEKLTEGVVPWQKTWNCNTRPVSWLTQKAYRGINALLLDSGEYATMNQINAAGGKVKKGQKGHPVAFFKWLKDEDTEKSFPMMRYYTVFEINTQCENMKSKRKPKENHNPIEAAEKIIAGYEKMQTVKHGDPAYRPSTDEIFMPELGEFNSPEEYYAALFHETVHGTGHKERLNRPAVMEAIHFGSEKYSKEELVAEIGAAMLLGNAGIETTFNNNVAYIQSWLKKLQDDPKMIITAASQAQKATDFIQGFKYTEE